jgi:cold shock CspA family protein
MREVGVVAKFVRDRGFGFISRENSANDLFFHISAFDRNSVPDIRLGATVEFESGFNDRGRPQALDCVLLWWAEGNEAGAPRGTQTGPPFHRRAQGNLGGIPPHLRRLVGRFGSTPLGVQPQGAPESYTAAAVGARDVEHCGGEHRTGDGAQNHAL